MDEDKRLWKLSDGRDGLRGKLGLVLMDREAWRAESSWGSKELDMTELLN